MYMHQIKIYRFLAVIMNSL